MRLEVVRTRHIWGGDNFFYQGLELFMVLAFGSILMGLDRLDDFIGSSWLVWGIMRTLVSFGMLPMRAPCRKSRLSM